MKKKNLNQISNFRSQIRQTLKKKAFEDAGIPVKQVQIVQQSPQQSQTPVKIEATEQTGFNSLKSADVSPVFRK